MQKGILSGTHIPQKHIHRFSEEYIRLQKKQMDCFYREENAVYRYADYETVAYDIWRKGIYSKEYLIFPDFRSCLFHHKRFTPPECFDRVTFSRKTLSRFIGNEFDTSSDTTITVVMDSDYKILHIDSQGILNRYEEKIKDIFEKQILGGNRL